MILSATEPDRLINRSLINNLIASFGIPGFSFIAFLLDKCGFIIQAGANIPQIQFNKIKYRF
jgi:hypothetical protein